MSVLVSYSYKVSKEKGFPKLMIDSDGLIMFFFKNRIGVVVSPDSEREVGYYDDTWYMSDFKDYEGEVTLKNE